jgi:hypothetical protein
MPANKFSDGSMAKQGLNIRFRSAATLDKSAQLQENLQAAAATAAPAKLGSASANSPSTAPAARVEKSAGGGMPCGPHPAGRSSTAPAADVQDTMEGALSFELALSAAAPGNRSFSSLLVQSPASGSTDQNLPDSGVAAGLSGSAGRMPANRSSNGGTAKKVSFHRAVIQDKSAGLQEGQQAAAAAAAGLAACSPAVVSTTAAAAAAYSNDNLFVPLPAVARAGTNTLATSVQAKAHGFRSTGSLSAAAAAAAALIKPAGYRGSQQPLLQSLQQQHSLSGGSCEHLSPRSAAAAAAAAGDTHGASNVFGLQLSTLPDPNKVRARHSTPRKNSAQMQKGLQGVLAAATAGASQFGSLEPTTLSTAAALFPDKSAAALMPPPVDAGGSSPKLYGPTTLYRSHSTDPLLAAIPPKLVSPTHKLPLVPSMQRMQHSSSGSKERVQPDSSRAADQPDAVQYSLI